MIDDDASDSIERRHAEETPASEVLGPLPRDPDSPKTEQNSDQEVQREVKEIEDRVKRAERWMIGLTLAIALFALCGVVVGILQWNAMSGQLQEMRSSSAQADKLIKASQTLAEVAIRQAQAALIGIETAQNGVRATQIGVQATLAGVETAQAGVRTAQIQATIAMDALTASKDALDASIETSRHQLRPYISSRTMDLIGEVSEGTKFSGKVNIINSGHTPAVKIEACGDILITPFEKPITDDWPCPSPGKPKQDREFSATVLGSGSTLDVSSPGTTASTKPDNLNTLLSNKRVRVYFYGYVTYHDLLDEEAVHHTTFCGLYSTDLRMWVVCEKHNKAD